MGSPAASKKRQNPTRTASPRPLESGPLIRKMTRVAATGPLAPRVLWIPGLGADRVMFASVIASLDHLVHPAPLHSFLEYPDVMPGEVDSLDSLAALLAQGILPEEPYDLAIGCSMGGMMLQILRMKGWLDTRRSVLLSTGMSGNDLMPWLRLGASLPALPEILRGPVQALIAALYPLFRLGVPGASDLGRMFTRFPRTILFEAPRWIRQWKGAPAPFYEDSIVVHGTHDPLISFNRVSKKKQPDLRIEGGSHILFATHAEEIAAFLAPFLSSPPSEMPRRKTKSAERPASKRKPGARLASSTRGKKVQAGR